MLLKCGELWRVYGICNSNGSDKEGGKGWLWDYYFRVFFDL